MKNNFRRNFEKFSSKNMRKKMLSKKLSKINFYVKKNAKIDGEFVKHTVE